MNIYFYATKDDISTILNSVQTKWKIKYIRFGLHKTDFIEEYNDFRQIETLGNASNESHSNSIKYVMCEQGSTLLKRQIERGPNQGMYLIDQLVNPNIVVFAAGGIWKTNIIIAGHFSTGHSEDFSKNLMNFIKANMQKIFQKKKIFYVGNEALELARAGFRLTQAEQAPMEYDLAPE